MLYSDTQSLSVWLCQIFFVQIVLGEISERRSASSKSECFGKFGNIAIPYL